MRLAFSIAIYSEPQILIVDEALSVGDAHFAAKCTRALKERKEQNMSIIYVSHDLNSLKILCDRVLLLNHGTLLESGTPTEVINKYNFLIAKLNDTHNALKIDENTSNSFGVFDVEIKQLKMKKGSQVSKDFDAGEHITIEIEIFSKIDVADLTIGIHIRDKYSQDIYGTNTFYQNKKVSVTANQTYLCTYSMPLNIGVGKFTLGAALHSGHEHTELCYHWLDDAVDFSTALGRNNFFIGLCRLEPTVTFQKK